jgi:alkyldihydroxyacetonephosphate synthase
MAPAQRGTEIAPWDAIKEAASDAIIASGGTMTYHHAVGKDHQRWYQQQRSPFFGSILAYAKRAVDPQWFLNPEVLLMPRE